MENFKLAFETDLVKLKKNLERLNIDTDNLTCFCCEEKINSNLTNLGSIYNFEGEIRAYCNKSECLSYVGLSCVI